MPDSKNTPESDVAGAPPVKNGLPAVPPAEQELVLRRRGRRLGWGLVADATLGFFTMESTFARTLYSFLLRPRAAFEGYLGADRLRYSNPLKIIITLTAVSTFVGYLAGNFDNLVEGFMIGMRESDPKDALTVEQELAFAQFIQRHFNLIVFGGLPAIALVTRVLYLKRAYNFIEHLALNSFMLSVSTAAYVLLFIPSILFPNVMMAYVVLSLAYQTWAYRVVLGPGWLRAITAVLLTTFVYFIGLSICMGLYLQYYLPLA